MFASLLISHERLEQDHVQMYDHHSLAHDIHSLRGGRLDELESALVIWMLRTGQCVACQRVPRRHGVPCSRQPRRAASLGEIHLRFSIGKRRCPRGLR
jgi:hypothetical protein